MKNYILGSCLLIATTLTANHTIKLVRDTVITGQLSTESEKLTIRSKKGHKNSLQSHHYRWNHTSVSSFLIRGTHPYGLCKQVGKKALIIYQLSS